MIAAASLIFLRERGYTGSFRSAVRFSCCWGTDFGLLCVRFGCWADEVFFLPCTDDFCVLDFTDFFLCCAAEVFAFFFLGVVVFLCTFVFGETETRFFIKDFTFSIILCKEGGCDPNAVRG